MADISGAPEACPESNTTLLHLCRCPDCYAPVILPSDWALGVEPDVLEQLARAACGCWILHLPDDKLVRLAGGSQRNGLSCFDGLPSIEEMIGAAQPPA